MYTKVFNLISIPIPQSPSSQRQRLQLQRGGPDIQHKCNHPNNHANNIGNIVSISRDIACTATIETTVLLGFGDTIEGRCDEGAFKIFFHGRRSGRVAICNREIVDEFEDEKPGECTAEVGDTEMNVS